MSKNSEIQDLLAEFINGDLTKEANKPSGDTHPEEETGKSQAATTGERSAEQSAEMKSEIPGESVEEGRTNKADSNTGKNTPINKTSPKTIDSDDSAESTKGDVEETDKGTSSQLSISKTASTSDLVEMGNDISANLTMLLKSAEVIDDNKQTKEVKPEETKTEETEKKANVKVGDKEYTQEEINEALSKAAEFEELAGYITGQAVVNDVNKEDNNEKTASEDNSNDEYFQKLAAEESVRVYKRASAHAQDLVDYLIGFNKAAMEGMEGEIDPAMLEQLAGGAGGEEAMGMGGEDIDPAMLEQLLAAIEAEEGGEMGGEMGGEDIDPALLEELLAAIEAEEGGAATQEEAAAAAQGGEMGEEEAAKIASAILEKLKAEKSNKEEK